MQREYSQDIRAFPSFQSVCNPNTDINKVSRLHSCMTSVHVSVVKELHCAKKPTRKKHLPVSTNSLATVMSQQESSKKTSEAESDTSCLLEEKRKEPGVYTDTDPRTVQFESPTQSSSSLIETFSVRDCLITASSTLTESSCSLTSARHYNLNLFLVSMPLSTTLM